MRTALLSAFTVAALLAAAAPARGDDYDLPRHRPRLTDPSEFDDDEVGRSKRTRKHARPIEEDVEDDGWRSEPERGTSDYRGSDKSWEAPAPVPRHSSGSEDALGSERPSGSDDHRSSDDRSGSDAGSRRDGDSGSRSGRYDDDGEWRDDSLRRVRTAEEELRDDKDRPRRLSGLDEPGYGLAAEVLLGAMLLDDAAEGFRSQFAFGVSFAWQFGRLFAPENKLLHNGFVLEAAYLHPLSSKMGTDAIQVDSGQHNLSLAVLFGYPTKLVHLYGKIGPAMYIQPVRYDVQGTMTEWTGVKGGVVYGIGARTTYYINHEVGIAARVELTGFRRHYLDDMLLSAGVGVAF